MAFKSDVSPIAPRPKGGMATDYESKLRDDIARDAMIELLRLTNGWTPEKTDKVIDSVAIFSYTLANAMLAARASTKKETE